jgi:archaellum component FlaC
VEITAMKMNQPETDYINRNVMEILVSEEIDRQINRLPNNIKQYLNPIEVATYALNRLPPLYASSQQGFNKQKLKGRSEHSVQITQEVRKGLAAIQKDLLRSSIPLMAQTERNIDQDIQEANQALRELAQFLPERDISWKNIVKLVKPLLAELNSLDSAEINAKKSRSKSSSMWDDSGYKR